MATNKFIPTLIDLGLTEKEASVYLMALSIGPTTILKIAQAAGLKRTTVYSVMETLKQKGLMGVEVRGWKELYIALDPAAVKQVLKKRENQYIAILPELTAMYNLRGGGSFLKYYEGLEGVKNVYEQLLRDVQPGSDYLIISDIATWLKADEKFFSDFANRRAQLPIKTRMLFQDSADARRYKKFEKNLNADIKLLPSDTKLVTNAVIIPQRLVIHQMIPPIMATVIENESTIQMQRQLFEVIWDSIK